MNHRLTAVMLLLSTAPLRAQTVEEIVARNIAARGGAERLHAVQTQRLVGQIAFGGDPGGRFVVELKRPGKMRNELAVQGQTIIQATDGAKGWVVNPLSGNSEAQPLSKEVLHNLAGGADFEGPLLDHGRKGNTLELLGKVEVEGRAAWKLKVTLPDSTVRYDYIDAESYLEDKWEGTLRNNGREFEVETFFHDYRPVDGVMISFLLNSDTPGTSATQRIVFDSAAVNLPIADNRFERP